MTDDIPKLRLAPLETAEELAHRCQREQRAAGLQREGNLAQSVAPFRVGSVRFLNAVPLTRGLEDQVVFATPSELAAMLQRAELDAGLVSVTEPLLRGCYDILDGVAIASLGEVKSVFLAHRGPIQDAREVFCDTASLASVSLLRVLLAERGVKARFKPLPGYDFAGLPDYTLLIGDTALDFALAPHSHQIWDLGAAWNELTGLPFVYAVWALRRGLESAALRRQLREARKFGLDTLDSIVRNRPEYDYDFRKDYLGWHIHYHLGADEKRGLLRFAELLRKHDLGPVFEPRYVV
ncbi:MAG: menaquinone biosynthesis protein [Verrucomicrobiota bacterium]|jgi:chorismate dehydratase